MTTNGYSEFVQDATTTGQINSDKGFIIEADSPIYVSLRLNAGGSSGSNAPQAGALVSKGENAFGTLFRVGTYTSFPGNSGANNQSNYLSFFLPVLQLQAGRLALQQFWIYHVYLKDF